MSGKLCFLIYIARSGSTLLARELDKHPGIGVTIEEDIPDGLVKGAPVVLYNEKSLDDYMDHIYLDGKFRAWGIRRSDLKDHLMETYRFPIVYRHILHAIHSLYFRNINPAAIVHKKGRYYLKVDAVREAFPDAFFLYINRDARAVYNSQKNTRDSSTGYLMATGILTFCFQYKYARKLLSKHQNQHYFYEMRYEDLIDHGDKEISGILDFMGIAPQNGDAGSNYYTRIPNDQKPLHVNLSGKMITERIDAWKNELELWEIYLMQKLLKKELREGAYDMEELSLFSVNRRGFVLWQLMIFHIKNSLKNCFPHIYDHIKQLLSQVSSPK